MKDELQALLEPHVKEIVESANKGNMKAMRIITLYEMYRKCPGDTAAKTICELVFYEWQKCLS